MPSLCYEEEPGFYIKKRPEMLSDTLAARARMREASHLLFLTLLSCTQVETVKLDDGAPADTTPPTASATEAEEATVLVTVSVDDDAVFQSQWALSELPVEVQNDDVGAVTVEWATAKSDTVCAAVVDAGGGRLGACFGTSGSSGTVEQASGSKVLALEFRAQP